MYVEQGKIKQIGSNDCVLGYKSETTSVIDLKGYTVIPGFNDAHLHLVGYALQYLQVNLQECTSTKQIIDKLILYKNQNKLSDDDVLFGTNFNNELFENKQFPTRIELDQLPNPIYIQRCCFHAGVCNSRLLQRLQLCDSNEVNTDSGLVVENAVKIVYDNVVSYTRNQLKQLLKRVFIELAAFGITSIQPDDFGYVAKLNTSDNVLEYLNLLKELENEGELTARIGLQCRVCSEHDVQRIYDKYYQKYQQTEFIQLTSFKIIADGSLGARTAFMRDFYKDSPKQKGQLVIQPQQIEKIVQRANRLKVPVIAHCIGDQTLDILLSIFERVQNAQKNGVVHLQITSFEQLEKVAALNLCAFVQPIFLASDQHICPSRVGEELSKTSYAFKKLLDLGVTTAFSTDCPVEGLDPFRNIYTAVTRKDFKDVEKRGFYEEQCLTVFEAVQCYTKGSAEVENKLLCKGKLQANFYADFVVLNKNIFELESAEELLSVKVLKTFVGGKLVRQISASF